MPLKQNDWPVKTFYCFFQREKKSKNPLAKKTRLVDNKTGGGKELTAFAASRRGCRFIGGDIGLVSASKTLDNSLDKGGGGGLRKLERLAGPVLFDFSRV